MFRETYCYVTSASDLESAIRARENVDEIRPPILPERTEPREFLSRTWRQLIELAAQGYEGATADVERFCRSYRGDR
jgi:hypothetical protein